MANMASILSVVVALVCAFGAAAAADVALPCTEGLPANFDDVQVFVGGVLCTESPCQLVRGETAECFITFTAEKPITILEQRINATALGITTPFPVPDATKGCDKLTEGYCPMDAGEIGIINMAFEVQTFYPKVSLSLKIFLRDQNGAEVACFRLLGDVV